MIRKRGDVILKYFFIALTLLLTLNFIWAANETINTSTNINNFDLSYKCLKEQVESKDITSLTNEELSYSILALGYDSSMRSKLSNELINRASSEGCWPKEGCKVKDTSLAILALDHISISTTKATDWLYNQTKPTTELSWYLEIDSNTQATCKISSASSSEKTITINADKTLSGSAGSCFSFAYNNYWLEVKPSCYGEDFKISCNQDFLTALIYKEKSEPTIFVSSSGTHTASVNGETTEKVDSFCFKQGSSCNYEGSLWATLILQSKHKDIGSYLPYLMALSSENEKLLPSSFLFSLTGFDQYYSELVQEQNTKGYWQLTDTSKRYYDTAIALRALSNRNSDESFVKSKEYLLSPSVMGINGCWNGNNIRDTAFLLYAVSPKTGSSGGTTPTSQCMDFTGYSCGSSTECSKLNGTELPNFNCYGGLVCCDKKETLSTCSALGGETCSSDETCKNGEIKPSSSNGQCCVGGVCELSQDDTGDTTSECEDYGNTCKSQCLATEELDTTLACYDNSDVCCATSTTPEKSYWWLWLLIILIILIILAIIFRNQLKIWWFKVKSKFSKSPAGAGNTTRPSGFPPQPPASGMMPPRRLIPQQQAMQRFPPRQMSAQQRPYPRDRELDATLKRIKDMGK